jgi:hypothetical protein
MKQKCLYAVYVGRELMSVTDVFTRRTKAIERARYLRLRYNTGVRSQKACIGLSEKWLIMSMIPKISITVLKMVPSKSIGKIS